MKQIIFIFMSLLCFSCSSKAQNQTADTNVQSDKKILVAYFSCTGTTEKAADAIAKTVGGKLYLPLQPIPRQISTGTTRVAVVQLK